MALVSEEIITGPRFVILKLGKEGGHASKEVNEPGVQATPPSPSPVIRGGGTASSLPLTNNPDGPIKGPRGELQEREAERKWSISVLPL